jgi:hypothetical protein
MPDPHLDLAPLIEPPEPPAAEGGGVPWPAMGGGIALLLLLAFLAAWWWRRRAPLRALRRLARSNGPTAASHALATLIHRHGLQPDPAWSLELERLRFARPSPENGETLVRLCREAEALFRTR